MDFDTQQEEKELAGINTELEQIQASLEQDFVSYALENTTQEDEELFFDNREQFYKNLLNLQNAFFEEKIRSKQARAGELQDSIQGKKSLGEIEQAKEEFLKANPDANIEEIMGFYLEETTNKQKQELESMPPLDFFNKVYELFKQSKGQEVAKEEELPPKLEGVSGSIQNGGWDNNPLNRY